MSNISKSTLKFFKENITGENTAFIPVFRDVKVIISEFREWFPIFFEENPRIEMPTDAELLEIVKRTLKEFPHEKILAFFNRNPISETHRRWDTEVCPPPEERSKDKGKPKCLTYTFDVIGELLKKELFQVGCGLNTLAFLGSDTQTSISRRKKSNVKVS